MLKQRSLQSRTCAIAARVVPPKIMKHRKSPRFGFLATLIASSPSLYAQTYDWGTWDSNGNGLYTNGDRIVITGQSNASVVPVYGETGTPHQILDPSFPFDNSPATGQVGFFHNEMADTASWSVLIDLTDFTLTPNSVIGFSNLDGKSLNTPESGYAIIQFLDSSGNLVPVSSASFLGSFDVSWQGLVWDANSTFDLSTGRWEVLPDSGNTYAAGSYFANVGDAFFLTNLPTNIATISYQKTATSYLYDSTLFYAGNMVPEPSSLLLSGIAGACLVLRRRRSPH